ncbi:DEP domain-containing protein 1B [Bagarius yarrelli]|uniref:DEP domain-containing protein 1B n=1 Tax=Bagarius yarrelli TaxID=175774 RepID=A0A556U380_BAGYA|nr:DEP domain-containing protein 1B [Bagarius yarrelli]
MNGNMIGPGPYRATKLWNETITLFRGGMPLRRHWAHFRSYDNSFTGSEAVDYLHELLKRNQNFGPEVTRYQSLQLLRKFLKNHVIEDVKGRFGKEDFSDNGRLYRFPPQSPLKPVPQRTPLARKDFVPQTLRWDDCDDTPAPSSLPIKPLVLNSDTWNKRHSIAIGEVPECKLIRRRDITPKHVDQIWKSLTLNHLQSVLGLQSLAGILDAKVLSPKHIVYNVFSVNKQGIVVLTNKAGPNGNESNQPMYPGFERDVFRTVAEHFQRLKEPLLTFQLYETFVSILANRRKLQLLMRLMTKACSNQQLPHLNDAIGTRILVIHSPDFLLYESFQLMTFHEVDLDELLATKLVNFMIDNHEDVMKIPTELQRSVQEHLSHLRRAQIKYAGADTEPTRESPAHTFCRQISKQEFEEQKVTGSQGAIMELLEGIIHDQAMSIKDKKKKLKQFQRAYPHIYRTRFPTPESEAAVFPERPLKLKPQLTFFTLKKKSLQPFQRSWSFRA